MRRFGFFFALITLVTGVGLAATGCNWTETQRDFPPNAYAPGQHHHPHAHQSPYAP